MAQWRDEIWRAKHKAKMEALLEDYIDQSLDMVNDINTDRFEVVDSEYWGELESAIESVLDAIRKQKEIQ